MTLVKLSILACFRYATQAKIVRANTRRRRCGIRATAAAHGESGALSAPHHETLDVLVDRMIADIVGRAHLLELSVAQDGDVLAQPQRFVYVVGDKHNGFLQALLQRQKLNLHSSE